ncbi:MAG: hypothetical protein IJI43_02145 [Bacilli bacterium]|nr:hypothetical protein [Bacilli bacterium]MBQ6538704.1 hypothetical protein [Bacilli bacterium]
MDKEFDFKEVLDDLHKDIDEERETNPEMAKKLDDRIKEYNAQWLVENENSGIKVETEDDLKGLEYEIIKQDPGYAEYLEDELVACYEEGLIEDEEIEPEERVVEEEPERVITNLEEWVSELSNFYVDKDQKLTKK